MAYPTVDKPYGLKPVNLIGGLPFAGATRKIPIASGYATGIFCGDVVQYKNDGTLIITVLQNNTSVVAGVIGVFLGCSYTDPNLGYTIHSQDYPASTVASDIEAYVCDDPNALFKVVNCTGSTADGAATGLTPAFVARGSALACNAELVLNTGLTTTGNSRMGVYINNVATILPMTVVDVVPDTKNSAGNFVEFIVKFTQGYHRYNQTAGV
jgi:hypothetical protein